MFTAALFTVAKRWVQLKCPPTDERIKQWWSLCTMEYHSAVTREEVLPLAAAWINSEDIVLRKVRQTELNTVWSYFYVGLKKKH